MGLGGQPGPLWQFQEMDPRWRQTPNLQFPSPHPGGWVWGCVCVWGGCECLRVGGGGEGGLGAHPHWEHDGPGERGPPCRVPPPHPSSDVISRCTGQAVIYVPGHLIIPSPRGGKIKCFAGPGSPKSGGGSGAPGPPRQTSPGLEGKWGRGGSQEVMKKPSLGSRPGVADIHLGTLKGVSPPSQGCDWCALTCARSPGSFVEGPGWVSP